MASFFRGLDRILPARVWKGSSFSTTESLYGKNSRTETDQSFYLELYNIVVGWICPSGRAITAIYLSYRQATHEHRSCRHVVALLQLYVCQCVVD